MSIFQIFAITFALFMVYLVSIHRRKGILSWSESVGWSLIWLIFIVLALFPQILNGVVGLFHFARVFDLLIVMALMVITFIVIISYFNTKALNQKIELLTRQIAMMRVKSDKPKKS